jgi:hypothetical protein
VDNFLFIKVHRKFKISFSVTAVPAEAKQNCILQAIELDCHPLVSTQGHLNLFRQFRITAPPEANILYNTRQIENYFALVNSDLEASVIIRKWLAFVYE